MEEKLQIVLKDYVKGVENVCNILIKSINCSENLNLKGKYDFMEYRSKLKKMEFEAGGISYRLHGKGCESFIEKNILIGSLGLEVDGVVLNHGKFQ